MLCPTFLISCMFWRLIDIFEITVNLSLIICSANCLLCWKLLCFSFSHFARWWQSFARKELLSMPLSMHTSIIARKSLLSTKQTLWNLLMVYFWNPVVRSLTSIQVSNIMKSLWTTAACNLFQSLSSLMSWYVIITTYFNLLIVPVNIHLKVAAWGIRFQNNACYYGSLLFIGPEMGCSYVLSCLSCVLFCWYWCLCLIASWLLSKLCTVLFNGCSKTTICCSVVWTWVSC